MLLLLGVAPAVAEPAAAATYYLDCAAGSDSAAGTGETTAWRTLAKVSAKTFGPDDRILIKRATTCAVGVELIHGEGALASVGWSPRVNCRRAAHGPDVRLGRLAEAGEWCDLVWSVLTR